MKKLLLAALVATAGCSSSDLPSMPSAKPTALVRAKSMGCDGAQRVLVLERIRPLLHHDHPTTWVRATYVGVGFPGGIEVEPPAWTVTPTDDRARGYVQFQSWRLDMNVGYVVGPGGIVSITAVGPCGETARLKVAHGY
jgi:hypothetical protein